MDDIPPSYEAAVHQDYWTIIAEYVRSSDDLCAASRVCRRWHQIYTPLLWGNPASHFGTENDRVYVALTRFKRSLRWVRPAVRCLTHTLHLPPAQAEIYDGPHHDWLRDVLVKLPNLQSLVVSQLPFFDHPSLLALRTYNNGAPADDETRPSFPLRLLIAAQCTNTTQRCLADALIAFPRLVFLDLSRTLGVRDAAVLSKLRYMASLQILKLCGIQLRDEDVGVLTDSIGIRVRSLDLRNNLLTDNAVRILLQSCFQTTGNLDSVDGARPGGLSGAADEDWPSEILKPDPAVLDEFRDESFDMRYLRRLTNGLVSRMPSEDHPHAGITHLYISDNHVTVEGLSSLIRSTRLHVLDAGSVDTARFSHRPSSSASPLTLSYHNRTYGLPGAEKLTPILTKYASCNLTSLRVDHSVVTKSTIIKKEKPDPRICELSSDAGLHELGVTSPAYELPNDRTERFELPRDSVHFALSRATAMKPEDWEPKAPPEVKRASVFAPEVVENQDEAIEEEEEEEEEEEVPVLTATGLGPIAQAINGIQSPISPTHDGLDLGTNIAASPISSSPQPSLSVITKQRQDLKWSQSSKPHGLLPTMLPRLRSLTLTDVPCSDENGHVIDALVQFIRYCASEAELAQLQVDLESKYSIAPQEKGPKPMRQNVNDIFALRRITLEMSSPNVSRPSSALFPGSPRTSQTPSNTFRTKSSTEDADSEAFWAAQEKDFSFFDDEEECGLPSVEPGSRIPLATLSEKMTHPSDNSTLPTLQQPTIASNGKDVVQELIKFRKSRKAAYEYALKQGQRTAEGYWPGEVKVVRWQGEKTSIVDYYGNHFEKGYIYR
ncbi:MAG: hypothetical protein Q9166_007054 [cf. Caloplaca sp. 2 TL-2023]